MDDDSGLDAKTLAAQLLKAILSNPSDKQTIESLIGQGAPLWYQDNEEGLSCLHAACYVQDLNLVKLFLENGAPWNLGI